MVLPPNTLLQNRYLILRKVGQGGMGVVYEAKDQNVGHRVALKQIDLTNLSPQQAAQHRQLFLREAQLLARLHHSALPNVSDFFMEQNGLFLFLVMSYIPGNDLNVLLQQRGGPLPVLEVLQWADHLLEVLEYLHSQNPPLIHRDIKPANIKILPQGLPILLDFGISKGGKTHTTVTVTASSIRAFTPSYAPLEQINGTGTDQQSDLYSLGTTLYHLLTGVLPPDAIDRATAQVNQQPDPLRPVNLLNPQVPHAVVNVLTKAMALTKSHRFASAKAMRQALQQVTQGQTPHNATTKKHNQNPPQNPPPYNATTRKHNQNPPQNPSTSVPVSQSPDKLGRAGNRLKGVAATIYQATDKIIDWVIDNAIIGMIGGTIIGAGSGAIYSGITGVVGGGIIGAIVGAIGEGKGKTIAKSTFILIVRTIQLIVEIIHKTVKLIIDINAIGIVVGGIIGLIIGVIISTITYGNYDLLLDYRNPILFGLVILGVIAGGLIEYRNSYGFDDFVESRFFFGLSISFIFFILSFLYTIINPVLEDRAYMYVIFLIVVLLVSALLGISGLIGGIVGAITTFVFFWIIQFPYVIIMIMTILGGLVGGVLNLDSRSRY